MSLYTFIMPLVDRRKTFCFTVVLS